MRTRVKPLEKKSRGGANNWRNVVYLEEDAVEDETQVIILVKELLAVPLARK